MNDIVVTQETRADDRLFTPGLSAIAPLAESSPGLIAAAGDGAVGMLHALGRHGPAIVAVDAPSADDGRPCEDCTTMRIGPDDFADAVRSLPVVDLAVVTDTRWSQAMLADRELMTGLSARCRQAIGLAVPLGERRAGVVWGDGFHGHPEHRPGHAWCWCVSRDGTARTVVHLLDPPAPPPLDAVVSGMLLAPPAGGGSVELDVDGVPVARTGCPGSFAAVVSLGETSVLEWHATVPPDAPVPGDGRWLSFAVEDLRIDTLAGEAVIEPAQAYRAPGPAGAPHDEYTVRTILHEAGWLGVGGLLVGTEQTPEPHRLPVSFGSPHVPASAHDRAGAPYPGSATRHGDIGWFVACAAEGLAAEVFDG